MGRTSHLGRPRIHMKTPTPNWLARIGAWLVAGILLASCNGSAVVGNGATDGGIDATPVCATGQSVCGTRCADLQADPNNCGTCGHACGDLMVCVAGTCQLHCPAGNTACNGLCVNLLTDNANCGTCGNGCPMGNVCSRGACGTTCATGLATCGTRG